MHANPLHVLMFTQETVTTGQIFQRWRTGGKKKKKSCRSFVPQPSEHQSKTNPLGEMSPRSDPDTSNDVFSPLFQELQG